MYMKDENSQPIFFDGESWTTFYPGKENNTNGDTNIVYKKGTNIIKPGRKYAGTQIQYYVFAGPNPSSYPVTSNKLWTYIRDKVKKYK